MKKFYLFLFIFFTFNVFANNYIIEKITLTPKKIYVGDRVECKIFIKRDKNVIPVYRPDEKEYSWVLIDDVKVINKNDESEIIIIFYPYNLGFFLLPPIDFTDFKINDIKLQIDTIQNNVDIVDDVVLPLYLPYTFFIIFSFAFFITIIPLFFIAFRTKAINFIKNFFKKLFVKNPYKVLVKECKKLKLNENQLDSKSFYDTLIHSLRVYLSATSGRDFFIMTTKDAENSLSELYGSVEMISRRISDIMKHSDEIRFGFKSENLKREEKDLQTILEVCSIIEKKTIEKGDV